MMKKFLFIGMIATLVSCGGDNPEAIKNKIVQYKEKAASIDEKIKILEQKLQKATNKTANDRLPVKIKKIKPETFKHYIEVSGNAEAIQNAFISPEIGGQIKKIHVNEGEYVKKGKLLITLNTEATRANLEQAKTALELAHKLYKKQDTLWKQNIGSEVEYLQAKSNYEQAKSRLKSVKAQLNMSIIKAPFDGIIDQVFLKKGEMASPGMRILQLVNLQKMKVIADASETYFPNVNKGQQILIQFPTYPNYHLQAPIYRKSHVIDKVNRTFDIEVRFNNKESKIKPNMIAILDINDRTIDSAIIVPSHIIKKDISKNEKGEFKKFLFIVNEKDSHLTAQKKYIETGDVYNNQSVVTKGLKKGDRIITEGYNTVATGTEIRIINKENE